MKTAIIIYGIVSMLVFAKGLSISDINGKYHYALPNHFMPIGVVLMLISLGSVFYFFGFKVGISYFILSGFVAGGLKHVFD